ncbi:hypothetical protein EV361DRAFT_939595 [Lentinula raphanica]|nr:hypothetical protein EV361DRAFT_939595 [Lentinula raphanica]
MTLGWRTGVLTSLAAVVQFGPVLLTPLVSSFGLVFPCLGPSHCWTLASVGSIGASPCLCSLGLLVPISLLCAGTSGALVLCLWGGAHGWPPLVCTLVSAVFVLCHWFLTCHWSQILSLLSGVGLTGRTVSLILQLLGLHSS